MSKRSVTIISVGLTLWDHFASTSIEWYDKDRSYWGLRHLGKWRWALSLGKLELRLEFYY